MYTKNIRVQAQVLEVIFKSKLEILKVHLIQQLQQKAHPTIESGHDTILLLGMVVWPHVAVDGNVAKLDMWLMLYNALHRSSRVDPVIPGLVKGIAHAPWIWVVIILGSTERDGGCVTILIE